MNNINITNFDIDLERGKDAELLILKAIKKKYPLAYKIEGKYKECDIVIPEIAKTVEVKRDYRSEETGNFFIECKFNEKPSGVLTTTADYWAIVSDKVYWYETQKLKEMLIDKEPIKREGEDGTTVEGYLLAKGNLDNV